MTLKGLDIQEDCIKAISNESLIFDGFVAQTYL